MKDLRFDHLGFDLFKLFVLFLFFGDGSLSIHHLREYKSVFFPTISNKLKLLLFYNQPPCANAWCQGEVNVLAGGQCQSQGIESLVWHLRVLLMMALLPRRLTFRKEKIFQTSMIMFHVNLQEGNLIKTWWKKTPFFGCLFYLLEDEKVRREKACPHI